MKHTRRGFTLIELMVSVAIVATLASIAIPNYVRYTLRARTSEATTMLALAKTAQYSWYALNDCFANTELHPVGPPGPAAMVFASVNTAPSPACNGVARSLVDVGIVPSQGRLFFQYQCTANIAQISGGAPDFTCAAVGDLDGDTNLVEYLHCSDLNRDGLGLPSSVTGAACSFPYETYRASAAPY